MTDLNFFYSIFTIILEFLQQTLFSIFFTFPGYYSFALILTIPCYFIFKKGLAHRKNIPTKEGFDYKPQLTREFVYSLISQITFAAGSVFFASFLTKVGYFDGYPEINGVFGWAYFGFSLVLMLFLHDTYFYWTHKTMHDPKLFKHAHKTHHLSRDINPLTSVAFHPIEAFINGSWWVIPSLVIPFSPLAFLIFGIFESFHTVYQHLGYELFPRGFTRHWLGKHFATSTHHNLHHQKVGGNYGLYLTFWDRVMGTEFQDYHDKFDSLTIPKKVV